jgi:hypothetical protein
MIVVLIRRFVRADRVERFLDTYRAQQPSKNPAFKGETLARVSDESSLPAGLRGFALNGPACVTFLNVAKWESWQAFVDEFSAQIDSGFDPEIETAPRQRAVLDVIECSN